MHERKEFNGVHRDEWVSQHSVDEVRRAASKKMRFHKTRVAYWLRERQKAEIKFKKAGLKMVPNLFNMTSNTYHVASASNMKREVAQVDNELLQAWQNSNLKAEQHKALVSEYSKWVEMLNPRRVRYQNSPQLQLTMKDMEFFGLVSETPDEDAD